MINLNQAELQALHDKEVTALEKLTINDTLLINNIIEEYYRNTSNMHQNWRSKQGIRKR